MSTFSLMDLNPLKFVNYSLLHCPHFNARGHNMYFGFLLFLYRDEDTKAPESFIRRRFTSPKSGIISSFLEDCLSVDSDDKKPVVSLDTYVFHLYMIFCPKRLWFPTPMVLESRSLFA